MANDSSSDLERSVITEPPVRRWPHPVNGVEAAPKADPSLHYIRCALSYQNQMLADIKALLQRLVVAQEDAQGK